MEKSEDGEFTVVVVQKYRLFSKKRILKLTNEGLVIQSSSRKPKFVHRYEDLQGITLSLRIDAKNFILHFNKEHAEEEWSH